MNPSLGSGMLLLIEKSGRKPVGHIAAVVNSNRTAWISMFIIDAAHRSKGMGRELFKEAVADAKKVGVEISGLDGVREQKGTCESS
jgi:predicted GNAT family acetyltransferase